MAQQRSHAIAWLKSTLLGTLDAAAGAFGGAECWSNSAQGCCNLKTQSPSTSEGNFWNSFQNLELCFHGWCFFFLLKCIQFFHVNVLVSGPVTFWSKMIFASLAGHGCMQWRHAKALDASSSSADAEFHGEETMRVALEQTHPFICMGSNPCVAIVNRFVYTVIAH